MMDATSEAAAAMLWRRPPARPCSFLRVVRGALRDSPAQVSQANKTRGDGSGGRRRAGPSSASDFFPRKAAIALGGAFARRLVEGLSPGREKSSPAGSGENQIRRGLCRLGLPSGGIWQKRSCGMSKTLVQKNVQFACWYMGRRHKAHKLKFLLGLAV